ncbi:MAG TPA: hypothetical protein PKI51_00260 [Anaerolineaceae bacterium]|jgi:hypothetical protein|nr:hypothetical protein [Anaerolineaceae bacterium]HQN69270.1 hypothetical protein [Anaerolineaceae bacterium]
MAIKNQESGTTLRNRLSRGIVLAIRLLMEQGAPDDDSLDKIAFVVLALNKIAESVDASATAWEKRDYWVKADAFRMEWEWVLDSSERLKDALLAKDWAQIASELIVVGQKLNKVQISPKNRIGEPWIGAYAALRKQAG